MQIRSAETAGFCFGVERAVSLAEQTAKSCASAVTLGPIIHNRHVVERFEAMGLREIARAEDAQPGQTVVIRAHGIPVSEQQTLAARGAKLVDATCPFVKKSTLSPGRPRKRAGICSSSARPRTRRSLPSRAIPLTRTCFRRPKRSKAG
ncbi:MAG: hypothetical protein V8S99_00285 [Oscillospiraceae bacterium]